VQLDPAGGREARVTILEQSSSGTTFEVLVPGVEVSDTTAAGGAYRKMVTLTVFWDIRTSRACQESARSVPR
jgi:hypothetical protein